MRVNSELVVWGGGVAAIVSYLYARFGRSAGGRTFIVDFVSGGVKGAIAKTLTAPIQNCQTALQIQEIHPDVRAGRVQRYTGVGDYFARTVREKGALALFEGNTVNVLRYFPTQAVNFACKDQIKALFPRYNAKTQFWRFFAANMASGGVAGALSLVFVYPLDYVRTVQKYDLAGRYKDESFVSILRNVVRKRGVLALYSGFGISVLGIVVYRAPYFGLFDLLRTANPYRLDKGAMGSASKFAIAQTCAVTASFLSYPLNTVRRRQQMDAFFVASDAAADIEPQCKGTWRTLVSIVEDEGPLGLFRGFAAVVFRTVSGALILVGYDVLKSRLRSR